MAVAGFAAANVMLLSVAVWAGHAQGMGPATRGLLHWFQALIALPAILYAGQPFFRGALSALRARSLHMDLPIAIGLGAGFVWGAVNTVRGAGEIYFDSVTALIFLLLCGRWVQLRQQRRAADAAGGRRRRADARFPGRSPPRGRRAAARGRPGDARPGHHAGRIA